MIRRFPSVFVLIFIITGITIADRSHLPSWIFLTVTLGFCLGGFLVAQNRSGALPALLLGFSLLFFSSFHFAIRYYDTGPNHLANLVSPDKRYQIFGTVSDWPDLKADRTEIKIDVDSISDIYSRRVTGAILLRVSDTTTALQRGDRVEFYGRIYPIRQGSSSGSFDYRRYLNMKGVFGIVYASTLLDVRIDRRNRYAFLAFVDDLRDAIRMSLYRNLSPSSAALASGFLIGETKDIPPHVYHRFRDSGTLHLLAVSGSNVALVVLFVIFLLKPLALNPIRRGLVLLAVIVVFSLLSYGEPSVIRASVMATLVIVAGMLQRRHDLNNIIAAAAVIILLWDPAQLFDVGFQLSFFIAWGLIFILPRLVEFFRSYHNRRWYHWLVFPFMVSLVAQVCSIGIIAFYFERIPLISPIANLVIVPLVSVAVVGILILLMAHLVLPVLGAFVGAWLNMLLEFILTLVEALGSESIPAVSISNLPLWLSIGFYFYLFLAVVSLGNRYVRRIVVVSVLIVVNVTLMLDVVEGRDDSSATRMTCFGIPQGVAAVVMRPGSKDADLVITSMTGRAYPIEERIIVPELKHLGVGSLNAIFVVSADYDAIDDILRLAGSLKASCVYISRRLEPSFRDVVNLDSSISRTYNLVVLNRNIEPVIGRGCFYGLTARGLLLSANGTEVIFCDCLMPGHFTSPDTSANQTLIIGRPWSTSLEDLTRLGHTGYDDIVCSKIVQLDRRAEPAAAKSGQIALPTGIHDLSRLESMTLSL